MAERTLFVDRDGTISQRTLNVDVIGEIAKDTWMEYWTLLTSILTKTAETKQALIEVFTAVDRTKEETIIEVLNKLDYIAIATKMKESFIPFSDSYKIIQSIKEQGWKVGIISDADYFFWQPSRAEKELFKLFDYIAYSHKFGKTKESPRFYAEVCETYWLNPEDCIMLWDRRDRDVDNARKANFWWAYHINHKEILHPELYGHLLEHTSLDTVRSLEEFYERVFAS